MIDFQNAAFMKLKPISNDESLKLISPILIEGENMFCSFKTIRDMVIFTDKRVIAVNVQGITGTKKDFTSLPYSKIQAFSVETAGTLDLDCELVLWFSGLGSVKFDFKCDFNIHIFSQYLGKYVL